MQTKKIEVKTSILIERPPEVVFNYITNFENNPDWQSGMVSAKFTNGVLREGATYDQVAKFLGKEIKTTFIVRQYNPYHKIQIESVDSTFPIKVTREVQVAGEGCVVKAVVEGNPGRLFSLARPVLSKLVQRSIEKDYAHLKQLLEA
ncbi:SRPBCC family protein [Alkalihalobacillus hwajinpoensis]|uniref:SRPBCC family protein n=1 Tax=Guptibacillus hwajinpoensis TaxID=208199 RepID=UPI001883A0E8|nr:SRPBCC family protein [Pseudalkalibacillus hwajinpoensis]MBF0705718.1 SRPBCC family protein [Pseudalkalibacillus hwajinpoensis]